jgi:hypothetical protein
MNSIKDIYQVKPIKAFETYDWLLNKHYAKRIPSISYAFGLYEGDVLQGVCTFGTPSSSTLRSVMSNEYEVIELNRLVSNGDIKKNALSYFVSHSLNKLNITATIVSYADTSKGHHGYIYQATNWIYTGLSAKRTEYILHGKEHLHNVSIMDMSRGKENRIAWMKEKFGDDLILVDRPRKHRYFYFLGNKKDQKKMRKLLPYDIQSYPKGDNKRYDASYIPTTQQTLF